MLRAEQMLILFMVRFLVHTVSKHKKWCVFHEQESFQDKKSQERLKLVPNGVSRRPCAVLSVLQMSFTNGHEKNLAKCPVKLFFKFYIHFDLLSNHCNRDSFVFAVCKND
jgi:hypothetical protein